MDKFKVVWLRHYRATSFVEAASAEEATEKVQNREVDIDDEEFIDDDGFDAHTMNCDCTMCRHDRERPRLKCNNCATRFMGVQSSAGDDCLVCEQGTLKAVI